MFIFLLIPERQCKLVKEEMKNLSCLKYMLKELGMKGSISTMEMRRYG